MRSTRSAFFLAFPLQQTQQDPAPPFAPAPRHPLVQVKPLCLGTNPRNPVPAHRLKPACWAFQRLHFRRTVPMTNGIEISEQARATQAVRWASGRVLSHQAAGPALPHTTPQGWKRAVRARKTHPEAPGTSGELLVINVAQAGSDTPAVVIVVGACRCPPRARGIRKHTSERLGAHTGYCIRARQARSCTRGPTALGPGAPGPSGAGGRVRGLAPRPIAPPARDVGAQERARQDDPAAPAARPHRSCSRRRPGRPQRPRSRCTRRAGSSAWPVRGARTSASGGTGASVCAGCNAHVVLRRAPPHGVCALIPLRAAFLGSNTAVYSEEQVLLVRGPLADHKPSVENTGDQGAKEQRSP